MSKNYTLRDRALAAVTQALEPAALYGSRLAAMFDMSSGQPVPRPFDQFFADLVHTSEMRIQFALRRVRNSEQWEISFTLFVNSFFDATERTRFLNDLETYANGRGLSHLEHDYEGKGRGEGGRLAVTMFIDQIDTPAQLDTI